MMSKIRLLFASVLVVVLVLPLGSCYKEVIEIIDDSGAGSGLKDWSLATHSGKANPNYEQVFNSTKVQRFDIVITADDWSAMQKDLDEVQSAGGGRPGEFPEESPAYFPCQVYYNDLQWYNVGIRYKGNSSLSTTYRNGNGKKPLRLEFDQFEDDYPEIKNQRFYGFKELSLSNNFNDQSLMREKMANELFREFGVPAPHASYYEIYVDHGEGPIYFGLYTVVEVVFNTMLSKSFGSETGNCYKPDGAGAAFATTGFDLAHFEKKTNSDVIDWTDIQELYDVLHASNRNSETVTWKSNLEKVLDVNGFLKWLAANTAMQNWDTYGRMTHNYYLYHDPADDLVKWIPWDNNEAFQEGKRGGALSFEFSELNADSWPMIGYLLAQTEYREIFDGHLRKFIDDVFEPSRMETKYNTDAALLQASADAEQSGYTFLQGSGSFTSAVSAMVAHCSQRKTAAEAYLK